MRGRQATAGTPAVPDAGFVASPAGLLGRAGVAALISLAVFLVPLLTNSTWDGRIALAASFAIVGLSLRLLTGYAGLVSLGHQGLVGIAAFVSAFIARPSLHASFFVALPIAGATGAVIAAAIGLVALRRRGASLAVMTFAFGLVAQHSILAIHEFTGGAAGVTAPRPAGFQSNQAYAYLCLLVLAGFLFVDWRVAKTKAGRAFLAVRADERMSAALGINVFGYRLLALAVSGFMAGIAGSLLAHGATVVVPSTFTFGLALVWLSMAVAGGLRSRSGVVLSSAFFALLPFLMALVAASLGTRLDPAKLAGASAVVAATLALVTMTWFPGGLGAVLSPATRWLSGGPFTMRRRPARERRALVGEDPG